MRVVLLASGSGTLTQSVLDACVTRDTGAAGVDATGSNAAEANTVEVVAVGSDRPQAPVLERARAAGVPSFVVAPRDHADRAAWDAALTEEVASFRPDWVVSAGFMRILGRTFVEAFAGRIINSHPALLPAFPGAHAVREALAHGVKVTGPTFHLVDTGLDSGPIIAQFPVPVEDTDTEETLHERIRAVERVRLVELLTWLSTGTLAAEGRRVTGFVPGPLPPTPTPDRAG